MAGSLGFYDAKPSPRPNTKAACWIQVRRKFFVLADLANSAPGKAAFPGGFRPSCSHLGTGRSTFSGPSGARPAVCNVRSFQNETDAAMVTA